MSINYEAEVKKVYKDAIFWRLSPGSLMGAIFQSGKGRLRITEYTTESEAWQHAYHYISTKPA